MREILSKFAGRGKRRREIDAIVVVVVDSGVREERREAMRMPGSAAGRRGMQLRAFNEVSRLAADSTRSEAAQRDAAR